MFNTNHYHRTETKLIPYEKTVTVNEHRAPTDKSVELLNQMQEKAKENIIQSIVIDENQFKGMGIFFYFNIPQDRVDYGVRFKLNGKEQIIKGYCDRIDMPDFRGWETAEERFHILKEFFMPIFSKALAEELIKQCALDLLKIKKV